MLEHVYILHDIKQKWNPEGLKEESKTCVAMDFTDCHWIIIVACFLPVISKIVCSKLETKENLSNEFSFKLWKWQHTMPMVSKFECINGTVSGQTYGYWSPLSLSLSDFPPWARRQSFENEKEQQPCPNLTKSRVTRSLISKRFSSSSSSSSFLSLSLSVALLSTTLARWLVRKPQRTCPWRSFNSGLNYCEFLFLFKSHSIVLRSFKLVYSRAVTCLAQDVRWVSCFFSSLRLASSLLLRSKNGRTGSSTARKEGEWTEQNHDNILVIVSFRNTGPSSQRKSLV